MNNIEISNDRVSIFEALKHLIIGGNVLLFVNSDGIRVFPLSHYVIERDPMGNVLEIMTKETVALKVLPETVQQEIYNQISPSEDESKTCDLYTCIKRVKNKF